jgi:hypothetical protein
METSHTVAAFHTLTKRQWVCTEQSFLDANYELYQSVKNLLPSRLPSKNLKIIIYNFASGPVWVWNLVSDIKGGT